MIDCQQLGRKAQTNSPASQAEIRIAEAEVGWAFAPGYAALLGCSNGLTARPDVSSLVIYATTELAERNTTYEVADYLPGLLMIGDDGGGRGIFIERTGHDSAVYMIGMGSMIKEEAAVLAPDLAAWVERDFPLIPLS